MPGSVNYSTRDLGEIVVETVADPGAATEFIFAVPDGYLYLIEGISCTFQTDATAVTRRVAFRWADGVGNLLGLCRDYNSQALSLTVEYQANIGVTPVSTGTTPKGLSLPVLTIAGGGTVFSETINLVGTDAYTSIVFTSRRWRAL